MPVRTADRRTRRRTRSPPDILLDRPGTITGTATAASGGAVQHGTVGIVAPDRGVGTDGRYSPVVADSSYSIDWLGPYAWPLLFNADDHASQWSGGVGNRLKADLVPVPAGATTDFGYHLKQGADLVVTVPGMTGEQRVAIYNTGTSDPVAVTCSTTLATGTHIRVIGGQRVKVQCLCTVERWYGGTDFDGATAVQLPATGTVAVTFPPN